MSVDTNAAATGGDELAGIDTVTLTIDGFEISVPKGTLVIRAAERLGIQIPRFCEHPLLDPIGACRQCLVDVEGQRKPMASCTTVATDGMVVKTQYTSPVAEKAQKGIIEFLLINHPLDCPVCDKGGECPLQNQTMTNGYEESRFHDQKRTYPKPIAISSQVLLDRERCVLCTRCTRFAQQVAGDPFIEMLERGALQQVAIYEDKPFESYFSGNTIQICPVGALTGSQYRFRSRPFDLVSSPSICEHCASGCQQRNDHRRNKTMRRLAGVDPQVNEEWNCDKGRWAFNYLHAADRLRAPLVRASDGTQVPTSWPDALDVAARGLTGARGRAAVLTGGRLTVEDAYAYAKFARVALGTNDIDMRARPSSQEEADFLATHVAGRFLDVTYADLEAAPAVLLVGFEAEEESPIVFLRLRKSAWRNRAGGGTAVFSLAAFESNGLAKLSGTLLPTVPGGEAAILDALVATGSTGVPAGLDADAFGRARELLRLPGAVILVGERAAASPGALSAATRLAGASGARLAWIPRRAGERGALEAGAMPGLLPGGRPVTDAAARSEVGALWACNIPAMPGRDSEAIVRAAKAGDIDVLVIAGVDPDDLPDPRLAREAIEAVPFVVSLELRSSWVTAHADVVLPVAAAAEKAGTFLDWEGRSRPFDVSLKASGQLLDLQVLTALADSMDVHVGLPDVVTARAELASLGVWDADRPAFAPVAPGTPAHAGQGEAVLATWHHLLDQGRMQDDSPYLAGTAKVAVARLSATTAAEIGATDGAPITVSTPRGRISLPLVVTPMPDRVVWLPTNSAGCNVRRDLAARAGDVVRISAGGTVTARDHTVDSNADAHGQEGAA